MQKTHWKKLNNPNYIGAYSLMDSGEAKDMTVTIEKVVQESVSGPDGKKEDCIVAYLKGHKPMILNATNSKIITALYESPFIEDWAGKKITLYVSIVRAFGAEVEALRIRLSAPQLPELKEGHPKWEGAQQALALEQCTIDDIRKQFTISKANEDKLYS